MNIGPLHFSDPAYVWIGLFLAVLFACGTWLLYRRETLRENRGERLAWLLPLLRVIAVVFIILMITKPVLRHRNRIGEFGRVLVFLDASQSMTLHDEHMDVSRKLLIARERGWISGDNLDTSLADAADELRDAGQMMASVVRRNPSDKPMLEIASSFEAKLNRVREQLVNLNAATLNIDDGQVQPGSIAREYWLNVQGVGVGSLTSTGRINQPPTGRSLPDLFEAPSNVGDDYGQRMRGYVLPPVDGDYVFWIASDDESVLYLSTDDSPANKQRIAQVRGMTQRRGWLSGPTQSQPIQLRGGRRYYIEALHKEGNGDDHLAVGWQLPVGAMERPIPGKRLAPYLGTPGDTPIAKRDALVQAFDNELLFPVRKAIKLRAGSDQGNALRSQLVGYLAVVRRWESQLRETFSGYVRGQIKRGNTDMAAAIARVEQQTRWERMQSALLESEGFLDTLSKQHDVELHALREGQSELLWWADDNDDLPQVLPIEPIDAASDLSTGLQQRVRDDSTGESIDPDGQRVVAVVISDGQHNIEGNSPQMTAAVLGDRRIPVHTVGSGALIRPEDLAVQGVEAPQTVFHDDRVKGEILLTDDMPPGQPFDVTIEHEGKEIFSQRLVTDRSHHRRVPFDFSVKELVEQVRPPRDGVRMINVPLNLQVKVSQLDDEAEAANNEQPMVVHAITEPRKVLIVDGRSRWETRYLRNLFERDKRWSVNALFAGIMSNGSWRRGDAVGMFPQDRETLFSYDLIVLGDVNRNLLRDEEIEWLHDYVNSRGGGLLLIDGRRGHLRKYTDTPLFDLYPIEWLSELGNETEMPRRLKLTPTGNAVASLRLQTDAAENAALWPELHPPHWVAPVRALEGTETLVTAELQSDKTVPVMVYRSYGAGKVIYLGMDESWRWRYEVGDLYHARFWNQLAKWSGEQPFAVQDQYAKLDAGKPVYKPGDKAEIRARLRDKNGKPLLDADVIAELIQDGKKIASIPLEPDVNKGGVFRGTTPALESGSFEVGLVVSELADVEVKARAKFSVEDQLSLEKRELVMNEQLLQKMAQQSGGRYYREEDLGQLLKMLEPLSHGKIVESETQLWRSYWWFIPIVLLFTFEWVLRKRAGML